MPLLARYTTVPTISKDGLNCKSGSGHSLPLLSSPSTTSRIVGSAMWDRRCGIGEVEEAANVGRVVFNDSGMGLKNIHIRYASSSVWCGSWGTVRQAIDPGKPLTLKGRLARILLIDWCCMAIDPLSC